MIGIGGGNMQDSKNSTDFNYAFWLVICIIIIFVCILGIISLWNVQVEFDRCFDVNNGTAQLAECINNVGSFV